MKKIIKLKKEQQQSNKNQYNNINNNKASDSNYNNHNAKRFDLERQQMSIHKEVRGPLAP